ncbi:SH3 domain-containing protein [Roseovarius sp. Pro17]|uniref:SH3 domain-containing protein n=1 Tax=Roseovarius sp. Pro17 TaxID=3108175 RepID=UPI002D764D02|nr:SH3 domain-containing protein [Roseovarius sp. Pro17]
MWRFILISFAFLGLVFYHTSGGSDYAPAPNSLQVAWQGKSLFAEPRPVPAPTQIVEAEMPPLQVAASNSRTKATTAKNTKRKPALREATTFAGLSGLSEDETGGFGITLASMTRPLSGGDAMDQRAPARTDTFDVETLVSDVQSTPIAEAVISSRGPADIRSVAGDVANMRSGPGTDFDKVDQLTRGTNVEILDRRGAWVELRDLDTGQTGWMADWLVTAAN